MDFDHPVAAVILALDAHEVPHARLLARELAADCDSQTMLVLGEAFAERGLVSPLADLWQFRWSRQGPVEAEAEAFALALNALAVDHMRELRFEEARPLLLNAIEALPQNLALRQNLASCALELGEFQGALDGVNEALARAPGDAALHELRGRVLYQSGDIELSVAEFTQAFDAGRASAGLWLLRALCLDARIDEAIEDIEKLLAEHPERGKAMLDLEFSDPGSPLQILRDDERARALFE
ncbi:hypothetical protein EDM80_11360 [bacterium]|nr:MAG: hypothetical protein EDM80_11360 [bacterium]